ncbi:MAG: inositol monophosphatase [Alphaproteobacteria bacterium]|nr:inositol monophosphatase [Alphaproteobacteria bacterium]
MSYMPDNNAKANALSYFASRQEQFPGVSRALESFFAVPSMNTAREVMRLYFKGHHQGDVEALNRIAAAFADKRSTLAIVDSLLADDEALSYVAERSYPHPIGFDKLVLYHDTATNFKFRLHIYWRGNQRASMERTHLHRFEMASAIITGELTNHTWGVTRYEADPANDIVPSMAIGNPPPEATRKTMHAYSGYWRDPKGVLHKKHLGVCELGRLTSETHVSGQSYAQILEDAHYVETNAETGLGNGDVCSTIYIHSGGLKDVMGRAMPILFEDEELADPDQIIETIPEITVEKLKEKLGHYKDFLESSLQFYDWLYDPRHGRNLSTGMIAGYLLAEHYRNPHILSVWIEHEADCKKLLKGHEQTLHQLLKGEITLADISDDDRSKRYYTMLLDKARTHPKGPDYWRAAYGDLVREMWRYCGALKGEKPDVTLLKPIWQEAAGAKLPGGAHYGHVAAMLEAAYDARDIALDARRNNVTMEFKSAQNPVTKTDGLIEGRIKSILKRHYPEYGFYGEETGNDETRPPRAGDKRFVVDPIDGTRNFANGLDDFATSIACQEYQNGRWETTDGVVSIPPSGKIYWAEKGQGSYLIERNDEERRLAQAPVPANDTHADAMERALLNFSIRGFGPEAQKEMNNYVIDNNLSLRVTGAAATMLTMSAENDYHAAVITAEEYDVAAGLLIAQEAGAQVESLDFHRDNRDFTAFIAARNPVVFAALDAQVRKTVGALQVVAPAILPGPELPGPA